MKNNKILINLFSFLISIVDYRNKKKIINYFKKKFNNQLLDIIDIGAHKGETIDLLLKNFKINKIYAFEPNKNLFSVLKKKFDKLNNNVVIFNMGIGQKKEYKNLNIMVDSSSSTFNDINRTSDYFKRKQRIFNFFFKNTEFIKSQQWIEVNKLSNIIDIQKINKVDLLKIDTEGYEYNVLKGIKNEDFKKIKFIYFEHHYDLMINKEYKYSDIHFFLKNKNFLLKHKLKMNFRKSFEYIYENSEK